MRVIVHDWHVNAQTVWHGGTTYQTANASTDVENRPEPSKGATFGLLQRVGHHDGALSSPQQTSADTQEGARENVEAGDILVNRDEEGNGVEAVADTTKGQSDADTQTVDNGTSEETNHGEGTVERSVL